MTNSEFFPQDSFIRSRPLPNLHAAALNANDLAQLDDAKQKEIVVLGIGNEIMGDDAIGIELLRRVQIMAAAAEIDFADIDFINGATLGMELLPVVEQAKRLLILDAVAQHGKDPGTPIFLRGDQVPRLLSAKLSPHQIGLLDVLTSCRLLEREPAELAVVGVVPENVDLVIGISDSAQQGLAEAAKLALHVISKWAAG
ncbi:HyaD/HybD family hydrogenase maturation endopeptidase [Arcanobacterium hippocoleae]